MTGLPSGKPSPCADFRVVLVKAWICVIVYIGHAIIRFHEGRIIVWVLFYWSLGGPRRGSLVRSVLDYQAMARDRRVYYKLKKLWH